MKYLLQEESMWVYSDWTDEDIIKARNGHRFIIKNSITFSSSYNSTYSVATYLVSSQNVKLEDFLI
jgi:hypothetical protein